jgi:hypothetical protein
MNTNEMSTNHPTQEQQPFTLEIGTYVVTQNLHANSEHSNRIGIIDSYIIPRNRYAIRVQGLDKLAYLKPENVRVATEYELNTLLPPTPDTRSSSLHKATATTVLSSLTPQPTTTGIPLTTTTTTPTISTEEQDQQSLSNETTDSNTSTFSSSHRFAAALTAAFIPALFCLWLALVVFSLDALPQITFKDIANYIKKALTFNSSLNPFEVSN